MPQKILLKDIKLSGGIGWGRLSGKNNQPNIFGIGNEPFLDQLVLVEQYITDHFFSGTNSPFFALSYSLSPKLEIIAEMSSDDYDMEVSL